MRRWGTVGVLLLILVLAVATACSPFGGDNEGTSQQLVNVVRGDLALTVSGNGNIEASREARLSFGSGGRIDRIYVDEGDVVSKEKVLAKLDTSALELARTQAEVALSQAQVALTQAEIALTQAQVTRQTVEFELESALDKKDVLELALLNSQIDLRTAEHNLEETTDLYTWSDIKIAQANVDESGRYLEYTLEQLYKYLPESEEGVYPKIEEDFTKTEGYKIWQERVVHAQSRLNAAKNKLEAMTSGSDIEAVAIKKLQVEAADMAMTQAQRNLDKVAKEIVIKELQVEIAKQSIGQVRQSVEQAQQSVELARQSLKEARKQLGEATITASFDGVVASVDAEEGDTVTTANIIVHLIDPTSMELSAELDEIDMPGVKIGQKAIIDVDALPDVLFEGKVNSIYPVPIEQGGVVVYQVRIELTIPEGSGLMIGMSTDADIIINERSNVLLVPDRAIKQDSQGNPMIKVMVNEEIEERVVVTGISDGFETEIVSGLLVEGEVVVVEKRAR